MKLLVAVVLIIIFMLVAALHIAFWIYEGSVHSMWGPISLLAFGSAVVLLSLLAIDLMNELDKR